MEPKPKFPAWYVTLRGIVVGFGIGCSATLLFTTSHSASPGSIVDSNIWLPLLISFYPGPVLAPFELYFAIKHYRAIRREMDGRPALA